MTKVEDIQIEKIVIGPSQSRVRQIEKDIDELASSIEKIGLLEPVVVHPTGDGKYELLTGQRRFLAVQRLGWKTIPAVILKKPTSEAFAKAISLTENFVRAALPYQDLVDACTVLHRHYGSLKVVAEETGLPYQKVREYVKADRLIEPLRKLASDKKIEWPLALKAQDAATAPDGSIDEAKALKFAESLKTMAGPYRKNLLDLAEMDPAKSAEEIIEEARKPPRQVTFRVTLLQDSAESLDRLAKDENLTPEETAADLIVSGLKNKGY